MQQITPGLQDIVTASARADCVFLTMLDKTAVPFFRPVQQCRCEKEDRVVVDVCMEDVSSPADAEYPHVALLIWDAEHKHGFEVTGCIVDTAVADVLDGYAPMEHDEHLPQVEKHIEIQVGRVTPLPPESHACVVNTEEQRHEQTDTANH